MKMQPWLQRLGRHFQGHVFLFEAKRPLPVYDSAAGLRLLLIFVLLEGVIGPRLPLFRVFGLPLPPTWLRVPVLLVLAMVLVRFFAGVRLAQIGLFRWTDWSVTEKSYFVQVFLIANVVFGILFAERLQMILADLGFWWRPAAVVIFTNFLWGFHQELWCTAEFFKRNWCGVGALSRAFWSATCSSPSVLCISTTSRKCPDGYGLCLRGFF